MSRIPTPPTAAIALDAESLVAVLDSLPHLLSLWDRDRHCVFANTSAAAAFGLTPTRMRGMTQVEVVGRHAVELVERNIEAALDGETTAMDRVLFDADGRVRLYQVAYSPNRVDGAIVGYSTMWVDITPQLQLLAEVSRDSARVARLLERDRMMGLAGSEVLDRLDDVAASLAQAAPGRSTVDSHAVASDLADAIAYLREASVVVEQRGIPQPRSGEEPMVVVGLDADLELAEAPARESWFAPVASGRLDEGTGAVAALLDELPVAITEWSTGRLLRYANQAAAASLRQWGVEDVVGRRLDEIADARFVAAIEPYASGALAGEAQAHYRRERTREGDWRHFHVRYVPRLSHGAVVGVYAYATDISLRIEAAQALTAARSEHASLQERQAIQDQLHAAVLQQLFGAKLAVEMSGRAAGPAAGENLAAAHASVTEAADSLRDILETP